MATYELPLFPLNMVLFPGMPLQLHVFEERYRALVTTCRASDSPFGVVLIKRGREANGPLPEPFEYGCTARISQLLPLADGRFNLVAVGQERFHILSLRHDQPYLVGVVEDQPLRPGDPVQIGRAENELRTWLERYVRLLAVGDEVENALSRLPEDPLLLAYLSLVMLQIPPFQKQPFLEIDDSAALFEQLLMSYRRETAIIRRITTSPAREQARGFSAN